MLWVQRNQTGEAISPPQTTPPWGNGWVSDEVKAEYAAAGWRQIDEADVAGLVFYKPLADKVAVIEAEYDGQRRRLLEYIATAIALGDDATLTDLRVEFQNMVAERAARLEAVLNG